MKKTNRLPNGVRALMAAILDPNLSKKEYLRKLRILARQPKTSKVVKMVIQGILERIWTVQKLIES